jgi:hypothetical protein
MDKNIELRYKCNQKILHRLQTLVEKYPQMSFGQILGNFLLDYEFDEINDVRTVNDPVYEESVDMWERLEEKCGNL